jgi:A/G-specific adenine glycosylase
MDPLSDYRKSFNQSIEWVWWLMSGRELEPLQDFFVRELLKWHKENRRDFPWRRQRDPFRVLVAELMLQRTRAEQVVAAYRAFIERFPSVEAVASARIEDVEEILNPLGLRHRIPRILALFRELSEKYKGAIPSEFERLIELPGVGRYIASAVLCFGFGKNVPIVDANVVRVFRRYFGIRPLKKRPHTDPAVWELAGGIVRRGNAVEINEAILDFASIICTPKPKCGGCPVRTMCVSSKTQNDASISWCGNRNV